MEQLQLVGKTVVSCHGLMDGAKLNPLVEATARELMDGANRFPLGNGDSYLNAPF